MVRRMEVKRVYMRDKVALSVLMNASCLTSALLGVRSVCNLFGDDM